LAYLSSSDSSSGVSSSFLSSVSPSSLSLSSSVSSPSSVFLATGFVVAFGRGLGFTGFLGLSSSSSPASSSSSRRLEYDVNI